MVFTKMSKRGAISPSQLSLKKSRCDMNATKQMNLISPTPTRQKNTTWFNIPVRQDNAKCNSIIIELDTEMCSCQPFSISK